MLDHRPYVELLGPGRARLRSGWTEFASDKRWFLLAYLAVRGSWVGRDRLAHLFWPDVSSSTARDRFRQLLRRTQRLTDLDGLEAERQRVRWSVETDLHAFGEALDRGDDDRAFETYTGPLLDALDADAAPAFATWLELERDTIERRWRDVALRQGAVAAGTRPHPRALERLEALLRSDPLDEEALRAYMAVAHATGRRTLALEAYRAFAADVRDELGLEPSSATRTLAEAVRAAVDTSPSAVPRPADPAAVTATSATPDDAFIGRDEEVLGVTSMLTRDDARLVSLVGIGGVGKSRIAQQVYAHWEGTAWFVRLEGLTDPADLPAAVADAIGCRLSPVDDPFEQIVERLAGHTALVVLDDYDELTDAAGFTSRLLGACPNLSIVVTSRVRLGVPEEWLFEVHGLAVPPDDVDPEAAQAFDAIRLFTTRAQQVRDGYRPSREDVAHLAHICRLVEGLPLGLELAATWLRGLAPGAIAEEIAADVDFLERRHGHDRHRSIRAVFERSWRSLTAEEQRVLATTAVFRDGFTRDGARSVTRASTPVLASLVDASLLRVRPSGRYDRHPLLYQYVHEKFTESVDVASALERHADYFLALAEDVGGRLHAMRGVDDLDALSAEHENLRSALRWGIEHDPVLALRLAGALGRYWEIRGHVMEGCEWLERCLAREDEVAAEFEARALDALGRLLSLRGERAAAEARVESALERWRSVGDESGMASALNHLGGLALKGGAFDRAESLYREALESHRARCDAIGVANLLNNLGEVARLRGATAVAEERYREALELHRAYDEPRGVGITLGNLGFVVRRQGRASEAASLLAESVAIKHDLGDRIGLAYGFVGLAGVLVDGGASRDAAHLLGVADRLMAEHAVELDAADRSDQRDTVERCRSSLGESTFLAALEEGRSSDTSEAVALVMDARLPILRSRE